MFGNVEHIEGIVAGLGSRQKAISNNIANAHTPGYIRQEETFSDVLGRMRNPFETPLSRKMGTSVHTAMVQGSGESVELAREMVDMQKNFLYYSMTTRRMSSIFNNLRKASQIGR